MLTASEIESLRRDKEETAAYMMAEFAKMPRLLTLEEIANNCPPEENEVEEIDSGDESLTELVLAAHSTSRPLKEMLKLWGVEKLSDLDKSEGQPSTRKRIVQPLDLTDTDFE